MWTPESAADARVREKIEREVAVLSALGRIVARLEGHPEPFEIDTKAAGLDLLCANDVRGLRNRARVKYWSPRPGRLLVWFHKRSALAWSTDRYSYGGALVEPGRFADEDLEAWIAYQVSGFHPDARPKGLRRAFPFDLPP